jgi:hypothetical protein
VDLTRKVCVTLVDALTTAIQKESHAVDVLSREPRTCDVEKVIRQRTKLLADFHMLRAQLTSRRTLDGGDVSGFLNRR